MSLYTLKHLLDDCSARPTRARCAAERKRETLEEVWSALNAWIDSRLSQGKGVHLATFASISWEAVTNARNQARLRPAIVLSDTFLKTHALSQKPARSVAAALAPLEDVNFTKIAIKFSRRLTKDAVYCGVRDLLQRLGQVAGSGAALSVAFCFGRLVARNRCVSALFDPQRLPRALEDERARSALGSALGSPLGSLSTGELDGDERSYSYSIGDTSDTSDDNNLVGGGWSNPFPHVFPTDEAEAKPTSRSDPEIPAANDADAGADASIELELLQFDALLSPAPPAEAASARSARGRVLESAFRRHIAALAGDVGREAQHARDETQQQRRDVDAMALEARARRESAKDIQRCLRAQMQLHDEAAASDRRERRATDPSANSFYSESEQERRGFEDRGFRRRVKRELQLQLQEQMSAKQHERLSARQRALDDDRSFLRRVRAEMEALELKQARDRDELRQALTGSWSRDAGLKQLAAARKKQLAAAQLAQPPSDALAPPKRVLAVSPPPPRLGTSGGALLLSPRPPRLDQDYSVGFDIRSVSGG